MTKSNATNGVEDVLSSVRKLVAGGADPAARNLDTSWNDHSEQLEDAISETSRSPRRERLKDRLILTPSFRVEDDENSPSEGGNVSDLSTALDAAEHGADQPEGDSVAEENTSPADEIRDTTSADALEPPAEAPRMTSLSDKIAALEAVIGKRQDAWESDEISEEDTLEQPSIPNDSWSGSEPVSDNEMDNTSETSMDATRAEEDAKITHLPSPTPPAADAEPIKSMDGESAKPEEAEPTEDKLPGMFDESSQLFDTAQLRSMVEKIVREELQGNLGVRITRNVRKLVRREIEQTLALKELD